MYKLNASSQILPSLSKSIREPFCALSHLAGAIGALVGTALLLVYAHGELVPSLAFLVYGLSMVALFTASAAHHGLKVPPKVAYRLLKLDYSAIYLLIAGSYAPICLITLKGPRGYGTFATVCTLAAFGILSANLWKNAPVWIRMSLYLGMGWILSLSIGALRAVLPPSAIAWIVAGGLCYTIGCGVYIADFPNFARGKFSSHDLWHVFVLGGSTCFYIAILKFIAMAC